MLTKIENYIQENTSSIIIHFPNDLCITVKPFLTIQEERDFVDDVLENSFTYDYLENKETYSPVSSKIAFEIALIQYFTDIPMISKTIKVGEEEQDIIDSEKMYKICRVLNIIDNIKIDSSLYEYVRRLEMIVNDAIKFKNDTLISQASIAHANENAINNFGEVCNGLIKILETVNTALEKNGSKMIDKLTKSITKDNMNKLISMLPNDAKELAGIIAKNPFDKTK